MALLEQALAGDFFYERLEVSDGRIAYSLIKILAIISCILGFFFGLLTWIGESFLDGTHVFLFFILIGGLFTPPYVLLSVYLLRSRRPTCTVRDGRFIVQRGRLVADVPLWECHWFEGQASQMTVSNCAYGLEGPAIIVEIPFNWAFRGRRVAVGLSEKNYEVWKAFFTIAKVPQRPETDLASRWGFGKSA